ncbi:MAG: hypothetical protein HY929_04485 [Euryarchaeota archaeon]|nr:hypothetical protein [Euryarchaeota archaeon]
MADALSKIKLLEELAKLGLEDKVVIKTIEKLALYKIESLERDLKDIKSKLKEFEKKYKISSKDFLKKYNAGELGDEVNFVQWASLLDMAERVEGRLKAIKSA